MKIRRAIIASATMGANNLEFYKTYIVPASWEDNTNGNPIAIWNAVLSDNVSDINADTLFVFIFVNNNATNFGANWMAGTAPVTNYSSPTGVVVRNTNQPRNFSTSTSSWVSTGATINVYKCDINKLQ